MYRVLALTGFDRSGTTFLGRHIQHNLPGSFFIGELDKGLNGLFGQRKIKCSCGHSLSECDLWSEVIPCVTSHKSDQATAIRVVYDAISQMLQPQLIIDSSKDLEHIKVLLKLFTDNHVLLHVVRNPKGIAFSRMKTRIERVKRGNHPKPYLARRINLMMIYDAFAWSLTNLYIEFYLKRRAQHYYRLIYENTLNELPLLMDKLTGSFQAAGNDRHVNHVIFGNINRFAEAGCVKLDDSWKIHLNVYQKLVIDFITFPVRLLFGYRF